jgi:LacI family transcriptional regulator
MADPRRVIVVHAQDKTMDLILGGIEEYRNQHPGWVVRHQHQMPRTQAEIEELVAWNPAGCLNASTEPMPQALRAMGVPIVSVRSNLTQNSVQIDNRQIGRIAADHLDELGAASYAMARIVMDKRLEPDWFQPRHESFSERLRARGRTVRMIELPYESPFSLQSGGLADQLAALPKPCAIFGGNDHIAMELFEFAIATGWRVPEDIAILGADDMPMAAQLSVPLSSVQVPHRQLGHAGAEMLDDLLSGRLTGPKQIIVDATSVAVRASTDAITIRDPEVSAVLRFIRMHAGESFGVVDAVSASSLGRRSIELRFRSVLGRSILSEIHRVKIERAKAMLSDPTRSVSGIAEACGFSDAAHFNVVFRKLTGMSPSAWRRSQTQSSSERVHAPGRR